jgi:hypothetical protein
MRLELGDMRYDRVIGPLGREGLDEFKFCADAHFSFVLIRFACTFT